jgi:hypothetical protein
LLTRNHTIARAKVDSSQKWVAVFKAGTKKALVSKPGLMVAELAIALVVIASVREKPSRW